MSNEWITIKGKLVNINNFDIIEWCENIDRYGKKSIHLSLEKLHDTRVTCETFYFDDVNEINDVAHVIAARTKTFVPIFSHDLADNGSVENGKWKKDTPLNETVNPNAEFIGE